VSIWLIREDWQIKLNKQLETIGWGKYQYYVFAVCATVNLTARLGRMT
jgi:hypothetical protein